LWIPNFSLLAKPLYRVLYGALEEPLDPSKPIKAPFAKLKEALLRAPVLGIPTTSGLSPPTFITIRPSYKRMAPFPKDPRSSSPLNI
jgi:hypothetical protein